MYIICVGGIFMSTLVNLSDGVYLRLKELKTRDGNKSFSQVIVELLDKFEEKPVKKAQGTKEMLAALKEINLKCKAPPGNYSERVDDILYRSDY